jgi:hypothetical protein
MGNILSPDYIEADVYDGNGVPLSNGMAYIRFTHPYHKDPTHWIIHIYRTHPHPPIDEEKESNLECIWEPAPVPVILHINTEKTWDGIIVGDLDPDYVYYFTVSAKGSRNRVSLPSVPSNPIMVRGGSLTKSGQRGHRGSSAHSGRSRGIKIDLSMFKPPGYTGKIES